MSVLGAAVLIDSRWYPAAGRATSNGNSPYRPAARVAKILMFGGLVFTVRGNTAVGVVDDELLVRVAPDDTPQALAQPGARPFEVHGRISKGWVIVAGEVLDDHVLDEWLQLGQKAAAALPPK